MIEKIFVNLPVKDLDRSKLFFTELGFSFNPQFTDATAASMVISEHIYAMLLTHEKFAGFTPKPISDAHRSSEVLIALAAGSRAEVDGIVGRAVAAGGRQVKQEDYGFMYYRSFEDLDGHIWEVLWMDPAHVQQS